MVLHFQHGDKCHALFSLEQEADLFTKSLVFSMAH